MGTSPQAWPKQSHRGAVNGDQTRLKIWYIPCIIRQYIHSKTATKRIILYLTTSKLASMNYKTNSMRASLVLSNHDIFPTSLTLSHGFIMSVCCKENYSIGFRFKCERVSPNEKVFVKYDSNKKTSLFL